MNNRPLKSLLITLTAVLAALVTLPATASASIDWVADAERAWNDEWANYSCENSSRFSRVANPSAQGNNSYRIEVRDGDDSFGERCEVGQGNPTRNGFPLFQEGEERWISYQVYLPNDFPVDTTGRWNVIYQLKQLGSMGTPALAMEVKNGKFWIFNSSNNGESCCTDAKWSAPAQRNRWVKFSMRVKFSPDPNVGFVELYGDLDGDGQKRLMPKTHMHTMKRTGAGAVPSHARIGIYRDPAISGTDHAFFDGYTVATTKAEAERRSFGAAETPTQPKPEAPVRGLDWKADAERPWNAEWANHSCESSSRISTQPEPHAQGSRAYRIEVREGDDSWGERCELAQGNPTQNGFPTFAAGEERWISYQVYLPESFPVHTNARWNTIFQLRQNGDLGTPAVSMEVKNGKFYLMNSSNNGDSCCTDTKWSAPAERNRWVKFSMRVKFSPHAAVGFVELYGDLDGSGVKRLTPRIKTHTMKMGSDGRPVPSHSRIGLYRDSAMSGTTQLFFDGYTVATEQDVAQRNAFAGPAGSSGGSLSASALWLRDRVVGTKLKSRVVRPVRTARITGGVRGRAVRRGTPVTILRRDGRGWRRIAVTRTRANGRFIADLRVRASRRVSRVRLAPEIRGVRGRAASVTLR